MVTPSAPGEAEPSASELPDLRQRLLEVVRERGYRRLPEPIRLSSGQLSHHFVDVKEALSKGRDLALACRALIAIAAAEGIPFDAVGGLTLGADPFAYGVAILSDTEWFVVRKERKGRGTNKLIEGAVLTEEHRVVLVEDVVSLGGSIRQAYRSVRATGADVVLASALLDRGDAASSFFQREGVLYRPVLTYDDLGIEPVRQGPGGPAVAG